jgi:LEA14-like dessication related protein
MRYFLFLLLILLSGCLPAPDRSAGDTIDSAEPIAPVEPLLLGVRESVIETFNPPGPDSPSQLELALSLNAQNPNPFALTLTRIDYELFLQDRSVSSGQFTPGLRVESGSREPLILTLSTPLVRSDLIKAAAQTFVGTPMSYKLEGTLSFSSANYGFTTRRLVLLQGELSSRQQLKSPIFRLVEGETRAFMLREGVPVIRALVQVENPGDVGYFIYSKDLEVFLNTVSIAKQDVSPVPLQAGQVTQFELLFYPVLSELNEEANLALNNALGGAETTLSLRGPLLIDVLGVDTFELAAWEVTGGLQ